MGSESRFDTNFDLKCLTKKWMFKQTQSSVRKNICRYPVEMRLVYVRPVQYFTQILFWNVIVVNDSLTFVFHDLLIDCC